MEIDATVTGGMVELQSRIDYYGHASRGIALHQCLLCSYVVTDHDSVRDHDSVTDHDAVAKSSAIGDHDSVADHDAGAHEIETRSHDTAVADHDAVADGIM